MIVSLKIIIIYHYIFLLIEIFFEKIKEFDWIKLSQREDIMHNMA